MKVVVVDDEQLAREELCYQLGQLGTAEVVAQAGNGLEAIAAVERHDPDLVFLDIQMPGLSGFEVARRLLERDDESPALIFVTAYDQHAIEAFEVNAVDYLLKPVDTGRLELALQRAHLVNINKIKEIVPWFSRNYILRMKDAKSTEIPVSRSQTKRLREYLKL